MILESLNKEMDELIGVRRKLELAAEAGGDLRPVLIEFNNQILRLQRQAEVVYRQAIDRTFDGPDVNSTMRTHNGHCSAGSGNRY